MIYVVTAILAAALVGVGGGLALWSWETIRARRAERRAERWTGRKPARGPAQDGAR